MPKQAKSFICPLCKEKQTSIIQWQSVSVPYRFHLSDSEYDRLDNEVEGEIESYQCESCKKDLPTDFVNELNLRL